MTSTLELEQRLAAFRVDMVDNMNAIGHQSRSLETVQSACPSVSTMTILARTRPVLESKDEDKIDLDAFVACFENPAFQPTVMDRPLNVKVPTDRMMRTGKLRRTFYNQISVWFSDATSKKNIKVFRNGNLHITGEKNPEANIAIARDVCKVLEQCFGRARVVYDFDVQMVNTNFRVSIGLMLGPLREAVARDPQVVRASYDPETYPGLNCKVKVSSGRVASVLVFNSGHVIITGIKQFSELSQAFAFITGFIDRHSKTVRRQAYVAK